MVWEHEVTGQLSDGAWENARPLDHWKFWCDATVAVDKNLATPCFRSNGNYCSKRNYDFLSLLKYDVVKARIETLIKLARSKYAPIADILAEYVTSEYYTEKPEDIWFFKPIDVDAKGIEYFENQKAEVISSMKTYMNRAYLFYSAKSIDEDKLWDLLLEAKIKEEQAKAEARAQKAAALRKSCEEYGITLETFKQVAAEINSIQIEKDASKKALTEIKEMTNTRLA